MRNLSIEMEQEKINECSELNTRIYETCSWNYDFAQPFYKIFLIIFRMLREFLTKFLCSLLLHNSHNEGNFLFKT